MHVKDKVYMNREMLEKEGPITIVAFGDSVTHGAVGQGEINYETVYWNRLRKMIHEVQGSNPPHYRTNPVPHCKNLHQPIPRSRFPDRQHRCDYRYRICRRLRPLQEEIKFRSDIQRSSCHGVAFSCYAGNPGQEHITKQDKQGMRISEMPSITSEFLILISEF